MFWNRFDKVILSWYVRPSVNAAQLREFTFFVFALKEMHAEGLHLNSICLPRALKTD